MEVDSFLKQISLVITSISHKGGDFGISLIGHVLTDVLNSKRGSLANI